ncbi:ead/Ea22-like family protein, partial [Escherichia coli]
MSKINYQALREIAKQATQGEWCAFISPGTGTYAVHTPGDKRCEDVIKWTGFDGQKNAENNARYIAAFNPEVVQALLDEREKNQQYIKRRDQENEMMVDAMHAAIALTSVGIDLDDYDECVLRLHEWGALPDYCIALYVDFVHGIVSKNKLLDFGYINGAPVWTLRDELEAAKSKLNEQREYYEGVISDGSKRIAELEACRAALAAENAGLKAICDDRRRLIMNGVQMG